VPVADEDLPLIAARCGLKAEGARWAATRQRLLKDGVDFHTEIEPHDHEIIARAKALPDCFLWMCHRNGPVPADLARYADLAGCFEAAGAAAALLAGAAQSPGGHSVLARAFDLAAEAQSALRVAIANIGGNPDGDQLRLFNWLRATGATRGIWISRFMRQDDPADPAGWTQLQDRLRQLDATLQLFKDRDRRRRKLTDKIRYHLKRIHADAGADHASDWQTIVSAVEELVENGVPPSNAELRELLLPVLDDLPEAVDPPKNFRLVLREIDRYLAARPPEPETAAPAAPAEAVRRAAGLLSGRAAVLIGGERRPQAAEALATALGLQEVIWVEGREQTYTAFEPHVARPDVAVVLLAIRWSSHGFGEVREFCEKYGKPLVRLPGGYSPNQVAFHIISQVGERLEEQKGRPTNGAVARP
jgi:hypothetical protein